MVAMNSALTRLRLGTCLSCLTNKYLKKINVVASDKCQICTEHVETIEHIDCHRAKSDLCNIVLNACAVLNVSPQLEFVPNNSYIIDIIYRNMKRKI